jgi:tetratricopeptide (TPR) repeat protein
MYNHILWTLDNEFNPDDFERLSTDLLGREGYQDIVPIGGTHDRGRDAEIHLYKGIIASGGVTFFQYSLEDRWENKLLRELQKVHENKHLIDIYVFVTSQKVTGEKRDKLRKIVADKYKWELYIYDREWLRHRLEEVHPDLAVKYHMSVNLLPNKPFQLEVPAPSPDSSIETMWKLYLEGDFEAASVEFKRFLTRNHNNLKVWQALVWCQYVLFRYTEALVSINQALLLDSKDKISLSLKASILTEDGIQRGIKANLILARDIFKVIAESSERWLDHYNYGNVLHALGNHNQAKVEFIAALKYDPNQAMVWKNLGTVYYHLHDHKEELRCYDKALDLNNKLSEALASKGVTLLLVFGKPQEAADLIIQALDVDKPMGIRWPQAWYWLGKAYLKMGNFEDALNYINTGLDIVPHHSGLLDLKALILSKIWRESKHYIDDALSFFQFRVDLSKDDYDSLAELVRLYEVTGREELVSDLLNSQLDLKTTDILYVLKLTKQPIEDFLAGLKYLSAYKRFRELSKIIEYQTILETQQVRSNENFDQILFVACFVSFGLACNLLSSMQQDKRPKAVNKLYSILQRTIGKSFPPLGILLLQAVREDSVEHTVEDASRILTIWPDIALLEISRQAGFLAAIFGIPLDKLNSFLPKINLGRWQAQIAGSTFIEINKLLKLVKEKKIKAI